MAPAIGKRPLPGSASISGYQDDVGGGRGRDRASICDHDAVTNSAPATTSDVEKPRLADLAPGLVAVGVMLAIMWGEEIVDLIPGTHFDRWGVRPRTVRGLFGIVFAPFLHTGFPHLIANTIPVAILGGASTTPVALTDFCSRVVVTPSGGSFFAIAPCCQSSGCHREAADAGICEHLRLPERWRRR